MEVVRDRADNCIIVCSIENVDPMGIHTGDSVTVAPALTLTDKEYQRMRDASIACLRAIGVDTGGSNVQFAVNPADGRMVIIEMNPRVSRSSALASKATGFPDRQGRREARRRLHAGRTRQRHHARHAGELRTHHRLRRGEDPALHLREIPRHAGPADHVDEVRRRGDGDRPQLRRSAAEGPAQHGDRLVRPRRDRTARRRRPRRIPRRAVRTASRPAADRRAGVARRAVGRGHPRRLQVRPLVPARTRTHRRCRTHDRRHRPAARCRRAAPPEGARLLRQAPGRTDRPQGSRHRRAARRVSACIRSTNVSTPAPPSSPPPRPTCIPPTKAATARRCAKRIPPSARRSSSSAADPNRIGQGIEFDYCCVHAAYALKDAGFETIMVNCNPETVSTDYDTSDRLYFEPLTAEDVIALVRREESRGTLLGCIVQYGGQTPLKLSQALAREDIPILGTSRRCDRHRRGPRALPAPAATPRPAPAGERHRAFGRGSRSDRRTYRLSGGDPPQLRAGRPRDGDRLRPRRPASLHARGGARLRRQSGADRPLPERRDRGRCGLHRRQRDRLCRRRDGAHRGSRHPFRRQRLLAAALHAAARHRHRTEGGDRGDGEGARRRRPDERAIRDQGRCHIRAGGEPARVAHRAVRRQGDRRRGRQDRRARHGRRPAGRLPSGRSWASRRTSR